MYAISPQHSGVSCHPISAEEIEVWSSQVAPSPTALTLRFHSQLTYKLELIH